MGFRTPGMERILPLVLLGLLRPSMGAVFALNQPCDTDINGTMYGYEAKTLNGGRTVSLSDYAGQTVLFVNLATY
ncbi:Epididymal secretory glutathione peroxidase [Merluccius polli]|uniref:Epididymal secretory glutathione peroxidase n=1 Tax=Merluccius polli TaxID=89951 RepID=A0AA47N7F2_MERPO|nr:Epididymal secretory glutathione peroxidase [Merluccius polli]